ncbi:L-histidine N(alpha)-methyltransferase [Pseudorhodoplanes sp.]|uniref:L-histidine N(alpha)-methyltransferase n=1 Tax=Pseudorhodoplanes sp. TaxID=1934341 RepID=UPI002CC1CBC9|nr:L-histidine N(alpha)-methyltransferase [Pseudorhodoplanes sp.]HWV43167.1 L-histidine N(alpha)-methyltransferase [Pseudorhodoplanes sp.]
MTKSKQGAAAAPLVAHATTSDSFMQDVIAGLSATPKRIAPKYFYDSVGSRLFEDITRTPEYYPTRSEHEILRMQAGAMVQHFPTGAALVEFGSGACIKVRFLLDAARKLKAYVPVDIAGDFLNAEAATLRRHYPNLSILPVVADFMKPFALPDAVADLPKIGFFPGSTIGNFEPHEAAAFLRHAGSILGQGAVMIVGVDLIKDEAKLNAAYNDAAGITGKFNMNLLRRINRELGGNFKLDGFEHHAYYNRDRRRIEMHLASRARQTVTVGGSRFSFRAGETIHTENSYKYSRQSFAALARGAGWTVLDRWTDAERNFAVCALALDPLS